MMLVISRKISQRTRILVPPSDRPQEIWVTLVDVDRGKVRLGFEADREVVIMRKELLDEERQPKTP